MSIDPVQQNNPQGVSRSSVSDTITGLSPETPEGLRNLIMDAVKLAKKAAPKDLPCYAKVEVEKKEDTWEITIEVSYRKDGEEYSVPGDEMVPGMDPMKFNTPTHQATSVMPDGNKAIISARQR